MASVFDDLDVGGSPLEAQIRQRWGRYGDWKSADTDQVAALASLLKARGVTDLDQLEITKTQRDRVDTRPGPGSDPEAVLGYGGGTFVPGKYDTYDLVYGGKSLGLYQGDINGDGIPDKLGANQDDIYRQQAPDLMAWSAQGHGNTRFKIVDGPNGKPVVVPTWGSSSDAAFARQGAISLAAMFAAGYGSEYLQGANAGLSGVDAAMVDMGAGATNVGAAEIGSGGLMEAMGGTSAFEAGGGSLSKAALYGAEGYGAGMTGAETAAFDAGLQQGADPTWWDIAKNVYNGIDQFTNSGVGKLLGIGAALALSKDTEPAPNDPMLTKADERTTQIGDKATDNAASDDAYFRSVFLPRYLAAMDQASARDKELYDFNMQRARLAAGQMDKFYGMVDAYDSEGEQQRQVGKAVAGARQANDANANMLRRRAMSMGLNPNSGAWGAGAAHLASRAALNEIFAGNMAREAARKEGLNLRATAAGLRGADSGYANSAASGANLGLGALTAGQQGVNANRASNNATLGLGLNAFSNLGGWGLSRTNSADSLSAANTAGWNGLLGYGLGQFLNWGTSTGR